MNGSGVPRFRGSGVLLTALAVVMLVAPRGLAQAPQTSPVLVIFDTELGNITMAIDVEHAPVTAKNFLRYVDEKFYDEGVVNRASGPTTPCATTWRSRRSISDRSGRRRDQYPPIPMEPTSVTGLKNIDGALSMARNALTPRPRRFRSPSVISRSGLRRKRNADGQGFAALAASSRAWTSSRRFRRAHGTAGAYRTESSIAR
jgi:peptidyl-prolyl cis-trans isomerase A (cyclophilin A)